MPAPPDPADRPPPTDPAGGPAPAHGSTGSHRPGDARPSLSDLVRNGQGNARRVPPAAELTAHLAGVDDLPVAEPDPDDAPTVITHPDRPRAVGSSVVPVPVPPPPYVVGEVPSLAGRRLGHFELIEAVGAGGMAAVLKARDQELGRVVALKILPPEAAADAEAVTRFKQEARAAAKLDHENVARVYFCGEDQNLHFIAFEFVEGATLRAMIDRRGTLPAGECVRYMVQVAAGLNHAADRGVVHRDIKPSNVIVTPDGRAKIVDMGLARHLEGGSVNGGVTQSGVTLGTFDYISPEQALDPRRADVRSDIYSLGCTFYHALTGRPPVPEGTAAKKLHAHQHVAPLDPRELNPLVPDDLAVVLSRMMAKDPARRYPTPVGLIADLKAVAARLRVPLDGAVTDSTVKAVPAAARVLPEAPRLRTGWVVAAAAVVVAAAVLALSASSGPTPAPAGPPWQELAAVPKDEPPPPADPGPPGTPPPAGDGVVRVDSAEPFAAALADPKTTRVELPAGATIDLTTLPQAVRYDGGELAVVAAPGKPARVRVGAHHEGVPGPGALVVQAKALAVAGVWFEVVPPAGEGEAVGLAVSAPRVEFRDCVVLPAGLAGKVTAVAVAAAADVRVERCLFGPVGVGVRVPGKATVEVVDSGLAPVSAGVVVRGDGAPTVRLDRSSFALDPGSAAVAAEGSPPPAVRVAAGHCVFAPAGAAAEDGFPLNLFPTPPGAVVRVPDRSDPFRLDADRPNAVYRVDPVVARGQGYGPAEAAALGLPVSAGGWVGLRQRPWDADGPVLAPLATTDPWRAFRVRLTDPDLFVPDPAVKVAGARFVPPGSAAAGLAYAGVAWPPPTPRPAAAAGVRVWWPRPPDRAALRPGIEYDNLVKLLQDVRSGDTVLIRHTGPLSVEQVAIDPPKAAGADRSDFQLTFKPDPGSRPVLIPARVDDLNLSLFRIREGRVAFENLEFRLAPGPDQEAVSAVTVVAGRGCAFTRCVFTLDEGEAAAAVVTLAEAGREMKMDGPAGRTVPRVAFDGCLIRGRGRCLWVPASRPFALDMDQCVTALGGPLVAVKAAGRDPGGVGPATARLTRVTALLGGPVVELQAGRVGEMKASGLVPVEVTADGCLFAAAPGAGRPVAEVVGADLDKADPNRVLRWERGEAANRYANFDPTAAVAVVRPGDGVDREWGWTDWLAFTRGESGRPVGKVTFAAGPAKLRDLGAVVPADVQVTAVDFAAVLAGAKPADAGADVGRVAKPVEP